MCIITIKTLVDATESMVSHVAPLLTEKCSMITRTKKTELDILNMLKKVQLLHLRNNSSENLLRNTGQRERVRQDYQ